MSVVADGNGNIYLRLKNPSQNQCNGDLYFDAYEGNYVKPGQTYEGEVLHLRDIIDLPSLHLTYVDKLKPVIILEDKGFQYNINVMYYSFTFYLKKK